MVIKRKQPERDLQNAIIKFLNMRGHFVFRTPNRGFKMSSGAWIPSALLGLADIIGVQKGTGKILCLEIKVGNKKPTDAQIDFLEAIKKRGGIAMVVYNQKDVKDI